jgi:hypothetical protein
MSIELFHFIQAWLSLDVIGGLWLAYAVHTAPLME